MKRLENGLIEGVNYIKDEKTGKIDWLKMLPEEYLYINQDKKTQLEKRIGKTFDQIKISEVKETELVITLQGIRFLLDLRGYKYAKVKIESCNQDYAAASCEICFIPNEEENFEQIFFGSASAHSANTKSWYAQYLVEASSNRALCRAVRNFLKINIVSREELGSATEDDNSQSSYTPAPALQLKIFREIMEKKKVTWEILAAKMKKEGLFQEGWTKIEDLPNDVLFTYLERIKLMK